MVERLDNPIKVGNPPPKVARVFVALSTKRTNSMKVLCNQILCKQQAKLKMKNPCPKTGRPWHQPSVQNMKLRSFIKPILQDSWYG
jgi:hypothetical protein